MKKWTSVLLMLAMTAFAFTGCSQEEQPAGSSESETQTQEETTVSAETPSATESVTESETEDETLAETNSNPIVYMTTDISPEGLMAVYEALGWTPTGNVAVKLSTGEPPASNYLRPELIADLVQSVDGTIVECNTAYGGSRAETAMHYQVAEDHGVTDIADFQIQDENGSMTLPVEAGKSVSDYLGNGDRMVYVNVMNRLSVDCDCNGNPAEPDMHDIGILASADPVALDQACIDLVYEQADGDGASLVERIESRNGLHTLEHAEAIGLGSRTYELVSIDE